MPMKDLSEAEVKEVIYSYQDSAVTDELYAFGSSLLGDLRSRADHINSKATAVLGWATGILAFLFAENAKFNGTAIHYFALGSSLCAMLAAGSAFLALRTRDDWSWPSDKSWLQKTAVKNGDELKRYHLRVMHGLKHDRHAMVEKKGNLLIYAETFFVLSGAVLLIGLLVQFVLASLS
jgi:hypothetical protein